jgi:hypothetical protein
MDYGHYPRNAKTKKGPCCKKCGKPHGDCGNIEEAKRRNFLKAFLKFMED